MRSADASREYRRRDFQRWVEYESEWGRGKASGNLIRRQRRSEWGQDQRTPKPSRGELRREYKKARKARVEIRTTHSPWWYTSSSSRYLYFEAGECWWDNEYGFCGSSTNVIDPQRTVHSGFS
jgi:hypothetical protein